MSNAKHRAGTRRATTQGSATSSRRSSRAEPHADASSEPAASARGSSARPRRANTERDVASSEPQSRKRASTNAPPSSSPASARDEHIAPGAPSARCETAADALAFVRTHGVVLASARGGAPSLAEAIAGEPIRGSWWSHRDGKRIFALLGAVADSDDVLACRLVDGKLTFVHRRLWPALVALAPRLDARHIARVREEHTASGKHVAHSVAFPEWVPAEVLARATKRGVLREALAVFGAWIRAERASTRRGTS